jgi:arylsulfatase A-like enzyme
MSRTGKTAASGLGGGSLAGVLDALATLASSSGVLGFANRLHLTILDAVLGALAGTTVAVVFSLAAFFFGRWMSVRRRVFAVHLAVLLLALPLLVYDAFALFHGVQASRVPGHHVLSLALVLVGAAGIYLAVSAWGRVLACLAPAHDGSGKNNPGKARPRLTVALGLACAVAAWAAGTFNRTVLPRLYPWFHLSLSVVALVLCLLAVRLFFPLGRSDDNGGHRASARWTWVVGLVAGALLAGGLLVEMPSLAHSQSLRFFVYEKTHLASVVMRVLPVRRPTASRAASSALGEALPALPPGPRRPDADIVLITIDAVRADHLGCYGYSRPTTPNIDALAARGVRFAHAYTQAPHTSFSLASVMIGKYYPTLARLAPSDTHETMAKLLRVYGWKTAAFFPPAVFYIDAHKMKAFEANNFDFEYVKYEYLDAEGRIDQIADFLGAEHPRKLFLWLHLFEPHEPYLKHAGFDFGASDLDRYDSEIAYADAVVGKVMALIQRQRPGAIVVVAADHGEEFGEHGGRYHGTTLFEEQVHVPLIIAVPGGLPHVVNGPVQLIDISATLLGLLDLPIPARMRGLNLGPWLASPPAPDERLPPVFAEVEDKRMVVLGPEKLICDVTKDYCSYFDLRSDAREQRDLADRSPDRVALLRGHLDRWLGQQARYEASLLGAAGEGGDFARSIELARLGDARMALPLAQMLDGNAPVAARREAAALLVTSLPPRAETLPALRTATARADDAEIRNWAAVAAMRLGATELQDRVRVLLTTGNRDTPAALPIYAALALAAKGDGTGTSVLGKGLESCDADVLLCKQILAAMATLKDPHSVDALVEHLAFVQTRLETVEALAAVADARSIPALVACLEADAYVPVRAAAAQALGRLGGVRSLQALKSALTREHEAQVLVAIRAALAERGR